MGWTYGIASRVLSGRDDGNKMRQVGGTNMERGEKERDERRESGEYEIGGGKGTIEAGHER